MVAAAGLYYSDLYQRGRDCIECGVFCGICKAEEGSFVAYGSVLEEDGWEEEKVSGAADY